MTWAQWADETAAAIRAAAQWRAPRTFDAAGPEGKLSPDGTPVVSFASNDYLGLTQHPAVVDAARAALERWGAGSGSARLIVGSRPIHDELETELAAWKRTERAVLFPSGYQTNLGVLTTFSGRDTLVCSDELNHASIIDGCRLSRARVGVYRHSDVDHLDELLATSTQPKRLVVTDTVFSMDGDVAPLAEIFEACVRHNALLVLDEAHAVLGPELEGVPTGLPVLRVGTLSKTLGAVGGFVAAPARFTDLVVNRARSYIFTTAPTPADAAGALAAVRVLRSDEGDALRLRLRSLVDRLRPGNPSPIVPFVLGDETRTLAAAAALLQQGMLVPAIRPPTVPPGTSRLRVTVSAAHTEAQVDVLARALADLP
jgi:8-amino-7-oxononanoate synthase